MAKLPLNLYIYPEKGALNRIPEIGRMIREHAKLLTGGGMLYEFHDAATLELWRKQLLKFHVLCHNAPIKPVRAGIWQRFLTGRGDPSALGLQPLFFGPFWHLYHGMRAKFCALLGIYLALQASRSFLALLSGFYLPSGDIFTMSITILDVKIRLQWTIVECLLLGAYTGFYGEHDLFQKTIRREPLWKSFPYARHKKKFWAALACVAFAWLLLRSTSVATAVYEVEPGITTEVTSEMPLIRVLIGE